MISASTLAIFMTAGVVFSATTASVVVVDVHAQQQTQRQRQQQEQRQQGFSAFASSSELQDAVNVVMAIEGGYVPDQDTQTPLTYDYMLSKYGPMEYWDTSNVRDMSNFFNAKRNVHATNFTKDLSAWRVDFVESFQDMFLGAQLIDFDVSAWQVHNAVQFSGMFEDTLSFKGVGLNLWNTKKGRYYRQMFKGATGLDPSVVSLHGWDVRNAYTMEGMFRDASTFGSISSFVVDDTATASSRDNIEMKPQRALNDYCNWNHQLYSYVDTRDMFSGTSCPDTSDPNLKIRNQESPSLSFCTPCSNPNTTPQRSPPRRPNILFIMTDQQRYDTLRSVQDELSQYSDKLKINTPNLDRLRSMGVYFENAYSQCPVCAPARTSIRTGCTIERTGIQHNDLITEYINGKLFTERVEALEGIDHILVEEYGYHSEYYGKWHVPDKLAYERPIQGLKHGDPTFPIFAANDYNYRNSEPYFVYDPDEKKNQRYLKYHEDVLNEIDRTVLLDGQQYDTYTGFPYTPRTDLDARQRKQSPTGTPLTQDRGFEMYEVTQPNILGEFSLNENYTPSHFTANVALKALQDRLLPQSDPWFVTVSFHHPHPPMVPATKHLAYYWNNRQQLYVPESLNDDMTNSAYGRITTQIPEYGEAESIQEWTSLYYALIEEIDEYVGKFLDLIEASRQAESTLIVFTSDHGEMMGAHGRREKNCFYEESVKVPLLMAFPGTINANTVVKEQVSHIDLFATFLDYAGALERDNSDGKSLRPFIEGRVVNLEYDEDVVVSEWDFRKPPAGDGTLRQSEDYSAAEDGDVLDRNLDDRPAFMVRKSSYKLMMQKMASTEKLDMMFNLDSDKFEMSNLIGLNGMTASDETIVVAEHLRCLLLDWMERLDGTEGYYSDPQANYGEGTGDINEVRARQSWKQVGFWTSGSTSSSNLGGLEFGRVAWTGSEFVRHQYLYMGTRLDETITVSSIVVSGPNAGLFTIDDSTAGSLTFGKNTCVNVRVTFRSPTSLASTPIEASIVLQVSSDSTGSITTVTVPITLSDYNFASQKLEYPPPATPSPTVSKTPTYVPTAAPISPPNTAPTFSPATPTSTHASITSATLSSDDQLTADDGENPTTPTLTPVALPPRDVAAEPSTTISSASKSTEAVLRILSTVITLVLSVFVL